MCFDASQNLYHNRAPDKVRISVSIMPISSQNSMFNHLLESSHWDDSNKWSNIGFGEEITQVESIEVPFMLLIWCSANIVKNGAFNLFLRSECSFFPVKWPISQRQRKCGLYSELQVRCIKLQVYFCYFYVNPSVWPLVRIVSLRQF